MFWKAASVIIWVVGLVMLPTYTNGYWTPKMVAWLLGGLSLLALQWATPVEISHKPLGSNWMAALIAWVSLKFILSNCWPWLWLKTTQERFPYPMVISTVIPTLTFLVSALAWKGLVQSTDSRQRWAHLGAHLCAYVGVLAVYGLAQQVGLDPLLVVLPNASGSLGTRVAVTVFGNPMLTANCLAICAPLCLVFKPSWCRVVYGLILLTLLLIQSATSLVAFLIGSSLVWGFRRQWRWLLGAWGFGMTGLLWMTMTHQLASFLSLSGRWEMWKTALTVWLRDPWYAWIGYSLGAVEAATAHGFWDYGSLHCEPLQILFELGIIGFCFSLGVGWQVFKQILHTPKDTLLIGWIGSGLGYLLIACVSFPLHIGTLLMFGVLIVAAVESLSNKELAHAYPA